jgi:uracil DNA glycosylase
MIRLLILWVQLWSILKDVLMLQSRILRTKRKWYREILWNHWNYTINIISLLIMNLLNKVLIFGTVSMKKGLKCYLQKKIILIKCSHYSNININTKKLQCQHLVAINLHLQNKEIITILIMMIWHAQVFKIRN